MKPQTETALESVDQYLKEASSMGLTLGRLLEIEARLAGYSAYIYQEAAKAQAELNGKYWQRKVGQAKSQIQSRNAGAKSAKDAENLATESTQSEIQEEIKATADYEILNGYCKGTDRVLTSLTHRIKNLEAEQARNTQQIRN